MSKPPINIIKPTTTAKCIKNDFLFSYLMARYPKASIGSPMAEGIKDVRDWL